MTNTQDKWYELTLSKNMSSAKKKLNVLLTKAYYVAWEEEILRFAIMLCKKRNRDYQMVNRTIFVRNASEKTADEIVDFCNNKFSDRKFISGKELLQEATGERKQMVDKLFESLSDEDFAVCLQLCFENEENVYWEKCIDALDLAACCKILSVGANKNADEKEKELLQQTYDRVNRKFPSARKAGFH